MKLIDKDKLNDELYFVILNTSITSLDNKLWENIRLKLVEEMYYVNEIKGKLHGEISNIGRL